MSAPDDPRPRIEHPSPEFEDAVSSMFDAFDIHAAEPTAPNLERLTASIDNLRGVYSLLLTGEPR